MKKGINSYFLVIQNAKRFVVVDNYQKKKLQKKKNYKKISLQLPLFNSNRLTMVFTYRKKKVKGYK